MKLKYFSILFLSIFLLTACGLKENYSLQYSFTDVPTTETKVEATADGVKIGFPFADFSCDAASFTADLGRSNNTFILTLSGTETEDRCSQKFTATISGIPAGDYSIQMVYQSPEGDQQVLFRDFTVAE